MATAMLHDIYIAESTAFHINKKGENHTMQKKALLVLLITMILAGLCLCFLNKSITYCPENRFEKVKKKFRPKQKDIKVELNIRHINDYLLKIKYKCDIQQEVLYRFNNELVRPNTLHYNRKKADTCTAYIRVPKEIVNDPCQAIVGIVFQQTHPAELSITLQNYRKKLAGGIYILFAKSGYKLVVTEKFIPSLGLLLTAVFFVFSKKLHHHLASKTYLLFEEKQTCILTSGWFLMLILGVNLWVYWPSFSHLFRHDEWFLFFSSKDFMPNLKFFFNHIDWQLHLPYDRLMFRPIHHGMLAFNRVVFEPNYIGPHILTFAKHLITCFCLWKLMLQFSQRRIAVLFALLFSVLTINIDPVIWPHLDAYIVTTIFTILAMIFFHRTINNTISPYKGFLLTSFFLLLNLLTTEIAFLMPFFFLVLYRLYFRKPGDTATKAKDRASWLILLLPLITWGTLFAIHIRQAYPDFNMGVQSGSNGLLTPLLNIMRLLLVTVSGVIAPILEVHFGDKVYYSITLAGYVLAAFLVVFFIRRKKLLLQVPGKQAFIIIAPLLSILLIICFVRARYIQGLLSSNDMACHYTYCLSALGILALYLIFDYDKILATRRAGLGIFLGLILLILTNALKTHEVESEVQKVTASLKAYFDSVKKFVNNNKDKPDFSFKIIDRPPVTDVFHWYSQTCIEGLFNHHINYEKPKYLLEYNCKTEKLNYSLYSDKTIIIDSNETSPMPNPEYVNFLGMGFNKILSGKKGILIGTTEVTQGQWKVVMGYNPSRYINDSHPVENVSFKMVQQFINKLNEVEGVDVYRLPTEEEYNCLIDISSSMFCDIQDDPDKHAWLKQNADGVTHPVGHKNPLPQGLFDVIGNVWEWTSTVIHPGSPAAGYHDNPRICFGLSWRDVIEEHEDLVTNYPPDFRHEHLGFRLVRHEPVVEAK